MIIFTMDVDWAPEEVIEYSLAIFREYRAKCTLFATHASDVLRSCDRALFEIAIHPNYNQLLNGKANKTYRDVVDELMQIYPEAKGARGHSTTQNTPIIEYYAERGLIYDSSTMLPYATNLAPIKLWNGMLRIPYNWGDDAHWMYGRTFDQSGLAMNGEALNILDFHPVHIFLNTESQARYDSAKLYYQDPKHLAGFVNKGPFPGTKDLLVQSLETAISMNTASMTLLEYCKFFEFLQGK